MAGTLITLTTAGRAALVNPDHTGTVVRTVTSIGIANAPFVPGAGLAVLPNQLKTLNTIAGENVAPDTVHVTIRDDSADQYTMYGFGLYLDNGVLLGTYSQDTPITEKSPIALLLLSADIQFTTIDAAALIFGDATFTNPPATETRQGVIEIADQAEVDAGADDARAVTPKKLATRMTAALSLKEGTIAAGTTAQYWRGDKTWRDLFTDVRAATLTGLSTATNAVIAATDTVLGALGKLQKQITDLGASKEGTITAGTTAQFWRGDKTWQDLAASVRGTVLTGLSTATNAAITASDTVLSALGKLQKQITDFGFSKENSIAAGTTAQYWRGDKTWQPMPTNLNQFTNGPGYVPSYGRTSADVNSWTTNGIYGLNGDNPNRPPADWGAVLTMQSADVITQLAMNHGGAIYWRGQSNSSLVGAEWRRIWDSASLTNLSQLTNGPGYIDANGQRPIVRRMSRYHSADGTSINNSIGGEHGFDYDTGGAGVSGPFITFGGLDSLSSGSYQMQMVGAYIGGSTFKVRTHNNDAGAWNPWRTLFHDGNTIPIANGGTGATTAAAARSNLGVPAASDVVLVPAGFSATISNTDLNNQNMAGLYRGTTLSNAPNGNTGWWYVLVESHDSSWVKQTATAYGSGNTAGDTYVRVKVGGAWTPWRIVTYSDSPALTGNPTVPTPAQFDNDTSIATTAFVKGKGVEFSAFTRLTGAATLTAAHAGALIVPTGTTAYTVTLPTANSFPAGGALTFLSSATAAITVNRAGTDNIGINSGSVTTFSLGNGDSMTLVSDGVSGWQAISGTKQLGSAAAFGNSKAGNGYQILPSGLIVQWGVSTFSNAGSAASFPIAFPNAVYSLTIGNAESTGVSFSTAGISISGFTGYRSAPGSASNYWIAIGA